MKTLKPSVHTPELGWLGLEFGESLTWYKCREEFCHNFLEGTHKSAYFCHYPNEGKKISAFFSKTEKIIGVEPRSFFSETEKDNILHMEPSVFWTECQMKRQLISIFLRAGNNYKPTENNYEEALWAPDIMGKSHAFLTREAISRFLFGFTRFMPCGTQPLFATMQDGWVKFFEYKDIDTVRKLLILPKNKTNKFLSIGLKSLWC